MKLVCAGIGVTIGSTPLLRDASLVVEPGTVVGLLGPNGSGKSTLLRAVYRVLRPATGVITLNGDDLAALRPREAARRVGVVVQESSSDFDLRVLDVVLMGRTPHKGPFARDTDADLGLARDALARVGATHLADRMIATLSGGERQRVFLARALAQQSPLLLLDEPTNHLDVAHQLELLRLVRELGTTTLAALHDLNLAAQYCDRLAVLAGGQVIAAGTPEEVLTAQRVEQVFGVRADPLRHPATGRLLLAVSERPPASGRPAAPSSPHVMKGTPG